jgi:threonine/homoserine/homoserine lactone efflux protein
MNLTIGPLALFALVASITPGPNNLLLMRSGARFGVRRSLWHLSGVEAGFAGLMLLSHLGIGALLLALPVAFVGLRWACFAYLVWLAIAILREARAEPTRTGRPADSSARPMSFFEGLMFQLINPKAWMMAVTVASAFYGSAAPGTLEVMLATVISIAIGTPCMLIWTGWGAAIDRVLTRPRAHQAFGYFMAALVLATALWMLR